MSTNEFTKEDLIDWLSKNSVDNKVSVQDVADLVADARFPQDLVQNAVKELAAERDDRNRHKEVTDKLSSGLGSLEDLRKRTAQMRADLDAAKRD
ncbi:MAG: hypothetical protein IPO12_15175 [Flavobacteriales bacterium]|nr:hypothetical protein [Flavobacteriales bacterium]